MRSARAPGRVTLIGDHTDYNAGLSLTMAIDLATEATYTPDPGSFLISLTSDRSPERWEVPLLDDAWGTGAQGSPHAALVAGLVKLARPPAGGTVSVTSTLPIGSGLSSSAAFSVALLLALGVEAGPVPMAELCRQAEAGAGSHVGLLDPLAIMGATAGHGLAIDFSTLGTRSVRIPEAAAFVLVHCGASRQLSASPYATRRDECHRAARHLGRPLGQCQLGDLSQLDDPVLRRRARHVITECERVARVERLLARGNLVAVGAAMTEGHRSLAEDFRVSIPEVDQLVAHLVRQPGVYGARMTGGGFGGCVIALCAEDSPVLDVTTHAPLDGWVVRPSAGAGLLG